jgi:RHS repeat-associated protein
MVVMAPPTPNSQGSAQLQHPLLIPPGRGIQPSLVLTYDSGAGDSWVGNGWDLSVGAITIDTRWGVPRYDPAKETESYVLDGQQLSPTAVVSTFQARVAERSDFTFRVETAYNLIIRHGNSPKNYWWEVRDKNGGIRWYGGYPDGGGPNVGVASGAYPSLQLDENAVLRDDNQNIYRWALSAERDVGVNLVRYFYDNVPGQRVGTDKASVGRQLYLSRIRYTGTASVAPPPAVVEDGAYEIRLLRVSNPTFPPRADCSLPSSTVADDCPRKDVSVNARGGLLEVTSDLLRRVEISYGPPNYGTLSRRYDLHYVEGAFGKTLLSSVDQVGSDGNVYATHKFDYFDDVRDASHTTYNGWGPEVTWQTGTDNVQQTCAALFPTCAMPSGTTSGSVLGASQTTSGDGHAYIGFNPEDPLKEGSFGGSIAVNVGTTEANAEFIDINGDGLPDKVWRDASGIWWRKNTSRPDQPGASVTFGDKLPVNGLNKLSTQTNVGLAGGFEAHLEAVDLQFILSGDVTIGDGYFADSNGDGLPDFVSGGVVLFNHLDPSGNPTFESTSAHTPVPVAESTTTLQPTKEITDLQNQWRQQSPLQDSVLRWVAPFDGTVAVNAPATLDPPQPPPYSGDGVGLAIQHNATQVWPTTGSARLSTPGATVNPSGVDAIKVVKGDRIYFRVQSIDDGAADQVRWSPQISYTSFQAPPPTDENGLSQIVYRQSQEFTLAGRPHTLGIAPLAGTLRFEGTLTKPRTTSDDVTVQVLKNGVVVFSQVVTATTTTSGGPISMATQDPAANPGTQHPDIAVAAPTTVNGKTKADNLEVRIAADSPIDPTAVQLDYKLYYVAATGVDPSVIKDAQGNFTKKIALQIPANTDVYPQNTLSAPNTPWVSNVNGNATAHASVTVGPFAGGPDNSVAFTVKNASGVVAKKIIPVTLSTVGQTLTADVPIPLASGSGYWFDLSIRDPGVATGANGQVQLIVQGNNPQTVPSVLNSTGTQSYFPVSYRGWGFAGYNGDGARASAPIDETAFVVNQADFQNARAPSGFNDSSYRDASKGPGFAFVPAQVQVHDSAGNASTVGVWRGMKDDIIGGAGLMSSSRSGMDSPSAAVASGGSVRAVPHVGIAAPGFSLNAGAVGASFTFGVGPSFGIQDYIDMNGDGFPAIVGPGYIKYTNPRGGFAETGGGASPINQDTSFAVGGGLNASPIDIKSDSKGKVHSSQPTPAKTGSTATNTTTSAAQDGGSAAETQYGFNVGGSVGLNASFTNPASVNSRVSGAEQDNTKAGGSSPSPTAPFEVTLNDVNGDGLPDLVTQTPQGIFVQLNLGYGFAAPIRWAPDGGFQSNTSDSASFGPQLGFTTPERDFSAGLGLSEAVNTPDFAWVDVNGDGILDRLRKDTASGKVMVAFGTNSGLLPEVVYGTMAASPDAGVDPVTLVAANTAGQQIALDDTKGLGAGFDFTVGIGPLCIVACYLIVNPGVHVDTSVSSTQIALTNVNGTGYPDVVKSTADNQLTVRFSNIARTNLLQTVRNPLGGSIRMDYQRDGNTVDQPQSVWTLARVDVTDGRSGGNSQHVSSSTFLYAGARYSRLERQMLGYSSVVEHQLAADGSTILRNIAETYMNDNIFDNGLLTMQAVEDASGNKLQETDTTWSLTDLHTHNAANFATDADTLLGMAVGPLQTEIGQKWFDAGHNVAESTRWTYDYAGDRLGNVVHETDFGQSSGDQVTATMQYSGCSASSVLGCPPATLAGGVPPFWSSTLCSTWTSLPSDLQITDAGGHLLRHRNGAPALCDNSSVTVQHEWFGPGANDFVESLLNYDAWGNYNHIAYPCPAVPAQAACADNQRSTVDYVYDDNTHAVVAQVTDSHGLKATATLDPLTGQIASRTDANNQTTSYTYDAFGRIATITGPYEQGTGHASVSFEYNATTPGFASAIAHNFDALHPNTPIDTASFVDGVGRPTQTKHNATLYTGVTTSAVDAVVMSGATDFDALGRVVTLRYPVAEPLGNLRNYNTDLSGTPTAISYDLLDRPSQVNAPGGIQTSTTYGFGGFTSQLHSGFSTTLFKTTVTDALGNPQTTWADVRGNIWAVDNGSPALRTEYDYDGVGQLVQVRDPAGNVTTHGYDLLGRETSTNTPDAGLVTSVFDGAGNMVVQVTPALRAKNEQVSYAYDIDRLIGITYPADSATPNVRYSYGASGAPGNGAGRVVAASDGARNQHLTYDPLGAVASEVAVMNLHNGPSQPFTTSFTHDGFGRLLSMTYPDGTVLTNTYDSGGLLSSMQGSKGTLVTDFLKRQEYDVLQNRRYRELGNGVHTEYNYDANTLRLAQQVTTAAAPARKLQDLNYAYDKVGNVLSVTNNADGPVPNLLGGPSQQAYTYDPYYRLTSAKGVAPVAPNKVRDYTYNVSYDSAGNVSNKNQCDEIVPALGTSCGLKASQTVPDTTYNWTFTYKPAGNGGPHQIATAGGNTYSYDANGNFQQVVDSKGRVQRTVTWDAANRVRTINDASSSTDYLYDGQGLLGVQRGPQGEHAFVNNWYQFSNDGWFWKEIWADDDHLAQATEQVDPATGALTPLDYYEHKDLQGSVNVVTDQTGAEFEHTEYFPSGEIWIHENSTTHRTPYRFVGDLNDEVRNLDLLGQRWYQPREQVYYSPEPLLSTEGAQAIDDPGLLSAYSYAESNPLRLNDTSGTAPGSVFSRLRGLFANRAGPRVWSTRVDQGDFPKVPTITVMYTGRDPSVDFGGHSVVFLAAPSQDDPNRLDYHYIDLRVASKATGEPFDINVLPIDGRGWPDPQRSSSWEISDDQARGALQAAEHYNSDKYTYSRTGLGVNRYNCALFAEKVLDGAGVQQSSGLVISTPYELVTGKAPRPSISKIFANIKQSFQRRAAAVQAAPQELRRQEVEVPIPARYLE